MNGTQTHDGRLQRDIALADAGRQHCFRGDASRATSTLVHLVLFMQSMLIETNLSTENDL
jgi:hypothetical protein